MGTVENATRQRRSTNLVPVKERSIPMALRQLSIPPLVKGEKSSDYYEFLGSLAKELNPSGLLEWMLLDEVAKLKWVSSRLRRGEAGIFDRTLTKTWGEENMHITLGVVLENNINVLERVNRLIRINERRCQKLLREFERLQKKQRSKSIDLTAEEIQET